MAGIFWSSNSAFDELVDKATSEQLPSGSEDMALNLEICDQIRSKGVAPKDAMRSLKRRLNHKNPNVQLLALGLVDVCIKNGGDHFLAEVSSREFMDNLVSILKIPLLNHDVKERVLRLIQNWSSAFQGKESLKYVGEVYKTLSREGFKFPPQDFAASSAAMVDTQTAPEWIDSDICLRCRTPFSFTNRKHHCRNCGQVFDQACSSKSIALPHFGIAQEVRVCDSCHIKLTKFKKDRPERRDSKDTYPTHKSTRSGATRPKSSRELADEELQRAIALSLEESSRHSSRPTGPSYTSWSTAAPSEPPIADHGHGPRVQDEHEDPDLKAAIEASLREAQAPKASAPIGLEAHPSESRYAQYSAAPPPPQALPNYDLQLLESDAIMSFNQVVVETQSAAPHDFMRTPGISDMYNRASGIRPKMAQSLDDTNRKKELLTEMNDKISEAAKLYDRLLTEQLSRPARAYTSSLPPQVSSNQYAYASNVDPSYRQVASPAPFEHNAQPSYASASQVQASPHQYYAQAAPAPFAAPQNAQAYQPPSSPSAYRIDAPQLSQYMAQPIQSPTPLASHAPPPPQTQYLPQSQSHMYAPPASVAAYPASPSAMQSPPLEPQRAQTLQDPSYAHQAVMSPSQPYFPPQAALAGAPTPQPMFANEQISISSSTQPALQSAPLPIFPSVPNSSLPSFTQYASPIERQDQKEAMLISFD